MEIKQLLRIPGQSVIYLVLCGAGILLFVLIGLYPLQGSLSRQNEERDAVKVDIEEQKVLSPLYRELLGKLQKKPSGVLPDGGRTALSVDDVDVVPLLIKKMAQECDLEAISVMPDVKSLASNPQFMSLHLVVKGDFPRFRKFLFDLERLPYMEHIEEMQIQEALGGRELRLKTWLAVSCQKRK
jgi:hypothetical protein